MLHKHTTRLGGRSKLGVESLEDRRLLANVPAGFTETVIAGNLTSPVTMDIDQDGRIWLAYQDGRIGVIEGDQLSPTTAIQLATDGSGERGLQGIELDPDFENNNYLYVYYTATSPSIHERVSRLTVDSSTGNTIVPGSELVLLDLPNYSSFPGNTNPIWHIGGAVHFLADGSLVVQVGDHQNSGSVQTLDYPLGKVLRLNKANGSPLADNPHYNAGNGITWQDYVWASGLRNPFSGDVDPITGQYFINDVGEGSWEEINDATVADRNFGWPSTEGSFNQATYPNFTQPFLAYSHGEDAAITGGAFNSAPVNQFPAEFQGKYFYSQFTAGRIKVVDPNNASTAENFITGISYPMNIEFAPDGSMYYIARGAGAGGAPGTGTGQVLKVQYALNIAPQIVIDPVSILVSVGYDATFSVSAAGTDPLMYQWQRDDGLGFEDIPEANSAEYVLANPTLGDDNAQFRVVVTNSIGSVTSAAATLDVTADTPPTIDVLLPLEGDKYRGGETITFSGVGSDQEDGVLDGAALTWQIDFHHDTHSHPFFPATTGLTGGQFVIPANSETSSNVWYRIHLTATDSAGLTTEVIRDIYPEKSDFTVEANLNGVVIAVDNQPKITPESITGVVGVNRSFEAPLLATGGGQTGRFVQWLDGETEAFREVATPEDDTAYVALYERADSDVVFLSDLIPSNDPPPNGWGPIEYDTSNGEDNGGDGNPMAIGGVQYEKGLGVHADSDVRYDLGGAYSRFLADIGIDDETGNNGSVVFQVYGDGALLYQSDTRTGGGGAGQRLRIDVDVTGVSELRLVVGSAGNGNGSDHADWANALLLPAGVASGIAVNFQPAGSTTVPGFSIDSGQVYGSRSGGLTYGWSISHTGNVVDRDAFGADDLLETHADIQANQQWEIALAEGDYAVTVSVGDAGGTGDNTVNTINVEGVSYWSGLALDNDDFALKTRVVTVADGRLSIDVGSSNGTAINFVEIVALPEQTETGLYPFFAADIDLNGKLNIDDMVAFSTGWGEDGSSLSLEDRVKQGDLDFDGDTDADDWAVFNARWLAEGNTALNLDAVINPIAGDYDRSGVVTQLDYVVWRSTYGSQHSLAADGNGDSVVDAADYTIWRDHLGDSNGQAPDLGTLALLIDPYTGESRLWNDSGAAIDLIGYSVVSTNGSLLPGNSDWNSLADQSVNGWDEASPTADSLSELNSLGSLMLQDGEAIYLGTLFDLSALHSGLSLEYTLASSFEYALGVVVFSEYIPAPAIALATAPESSLAIDEAVVEQAIDPIASFITFQEPALIKSGESIGTVPRMAFDFGRQQRNQTLLQVARDSAVGGGSSNADDVDIAFEHFGGDQSSSDSADGSGGGLGRFGRTYTGWAFHGWG